MERQSYTADQWVKLRGGRALLAQAIQEAKQAVTRAEDAVAIKASTPPPPPSFSSPFAFNTSGGGGG